VGRGFNHFKNPVAERQRTLKTRLREFDWGMLWSVKSLSNTPLRSTEGTSAREWLKYREPINFGTLKYVGATRNCLL